MVHGGYGKARVAMSERSKRRPKVLAVVKKSKDNEANPVSVRNQIRSVERILRRDLPQEVKTYQENKLEELKNKLEKLKNKLEINNRLAIERQIFLRDRKIKFFERRKIERRLRRLEKQHRASIGQDQESPAAANELTKLKEDLEYVKFFPKTEKYVSLFVGGDGAEIVEKRNIIRKQIKANLIAAAASGKDLEETGSEDDGLLDLSEDDFFLNGSSSDDADADDEWSARDQVSSASGKAASGMFSDEKNQRQISARSLMPPPGPSGKPFSNSFKNQPRLAEASSKRAEISTTSSNTSSSAGRSAIRKRVPVVTTITTGTGNNSNLSSNSDARKPRRKRRPKKKKAQVT